LRWFTALEHWIPFAVRGLHQAEDFAFRPLRER
jgi:hypothetical protein